MSCPHVIIESGAWVGHHDSLHTVKDEDRPGRQVHVGVKEEALVLVFRLELAALERESQLHNSNHLNPTSAIQLEPINQFFTMNEWLSYCQSLNRQHNKAQTNLSDGRPLHHSTLAPVFGWKDPSSVSLSPGSSLS